MPEFYFHKSGRNWQFIFLLHFTFAADDVGTINLSLFHSFVKTGMNIIDVLGVMPYFLSLTLSFMKTNGLDK